MGLGHVPSAGLPTQKPCWGYVAARVRQWSGQFFVSVMGYPAKHQGQNPSYDLDVSSWRE